MTTLLLLGWVLAVYQTTRAYQWKKACLSWKKASRAWEKAYLHPRQGVYVETEVAT